MNIEVRKDNRQFKVFKDGKPTSTGCDKCMHYRGEKDCGMARDKKGEYRSDDKMYLFCGSVCGYFALDI